MDGHFVQVPKLDNCRGQGDRQKDLGRDEHTPHTQDKTDHDADENDQVKVSPAESDKAGCKRRGCAGYREPCDDKTDREDDAKCLGDQ